MGEYVLSYNYIAAPFMYGKIKYSSPYRTTKYSFIFHKDHKSRFVRVPNQPDRFYTEPYRLRIIDNPEKVHKNISHQMSVFESLSDRLERDTSPMFIDNDSTTDVFGYKTNTKGTRAYNNIKSVYKTFNKGLFVDNEETYISDDGKYRNVLVQDSNNNAYKTLEFGLSVFNHYFADKDRNRYTRYYNKDVSVYKTHLKNLALFLCDSTFDKLITGKSIITYNGVDGESALKDRIGTVINGDTIIWKKSFDSFEVEFSGASKDTNRVSFISDNLFSHKDIANVFEQHVHSAKNMVGGRNIINEKYSSAEVHRDMPMLNMYENNNSWKVNPKISDMYEDSSFEIPKRMFLVNSDNAYKVFADTMPDIAGSFFNIGIRNTYLQYENPMGYSDNKRMSVIELNAHGKKYDNEFIINNILIGYKQMPSISFFENDYLSKNDYNIATDKDFMGKKNYNIKVHAFDYMLGLPYGKDTSDFEVSFGRKKSDKWNLFGDSGNAAYKQYKDISDFEILNALGVGKDSIAFEAYLVSHGNDRSTNIFPSFNAYKVWHSTDLHSDELFNKTPHGTAPTFTQYMMYKDVYYVETLYKSHGLQFIHDETFGFRRIYHAFTSDGIMLAENGIRRKYGGVYYNVPLAYKSNVSSNETEYCSLLRYSVYANADDYFKGAYKSAKSSYENTYYSLSRTIYNLISPDTDTNVFKSWKASHILSPVIMGNRKDRFAFADNTSSIGTAKLAKDVLNINAVFGMRSNYYAGYSYDNTLSYKNAHHTDPTDWMHLFVDYTGAIGRDVFVYDASLIHKSAINTSTTGDNLIFTHKNIRNIYTSDENTFSLKRITDVFLSFTENVYKMYTDTFTESVNGFSAYKVDRMTNVDDSNKFIRPTDKNTVTIDTMAMVTKRYYDVINSSSYSNLFVHKVIRDTVTQDNIPYVEKPYNITDIISPLTYISKTDNNTTTDYNGIYVYKMWRAVPVNHAGEGINKTLLKIMEGYNGDDVHKKHADSWYVRFDDRINKTRLGLSIEKYYEEIEHIRRKMALMKSEPYIVKSSYEFTPSIYTFEEIFKTEGIPYFEKNIAWIHKKNVISSYFSSNDLNVFKNLRGISLADITTTWITIPKYAKDMYPTEVSVDKTIRPVQVDDSKFNNVFRNMFSVDTWMMINANAGSLIGISARNLNAYTNLDTLVSKVSRDTMTANDLISTLKVSRYINEGSIIPIDSLSKPTYENNEHIPADISKNLFFDDGLFTYKMRRSVGTFLNRMVVKDKIKTFIDNYSLSIYKKSFDILAHYSGYIIHKESKPIEVNINGIMVYKTPYDTAVRDTAKWFSIVKKLFTSSMESIRERDNITTVYQEIPITTRTKEIFMYDMLTSSYERYVSLYENVYSTTYQKTSVINNDVYIPSKQKTATMNPQDNAAGHGKTAIINMTSVADEIKRMTSIAELEAINIDKTNSLSIISLDGHNGGHGDILLVPVTKLYGNASYVELDTVLKKYMELNIHPNDFGSWAWVEEPENYFNDYNDLQLYGGIDELLLPEQDYRYEKFEDILFNRKTNRPRNPIRRINNNTWICKYPTKHPFKNTHPNAGVAYVGEKKDNYYGVNVKIMQEIYLKYYQIWQENLFRFSTMSMHEASNAMLEYIYSWIILYYPTENLEQAMRVFRQIRWFSECAVLNNSQYIISGDWVDLKMLDIPNNLDDNDTMYYDESTFSIRNTKESLGTKDPETGEIVGRTEASVEFTFKVWKDTILTFSVLTRYGTMELYIDDELIDTISSTRRFNSYPVKFTDEEVTIRFVKTAENNVGDFLLADIRLKDQKFGELEVQFDPKLKAGNKAINTVADKMAKWANVYDDAAEALTELQKKNIGIAVTVDMMKDYLELHHKNKTKGKRLTIKKT